MEKSHFDILNARFVSQSATVGIFLLLFVAGLDYARTVVLPVISAVIIGTVLDPLLQRAERFRIPPIAFASLALGLLLSATYVVIHILSDPIVHVIRNAPETAAIIRDKFRAFDAGLFDAVLSALRPMQDISENSGSAKTPIDIAGLVQPVLAFLTPALGELAVFFATLFLFLIDQNRLRRKFILVFPDHHARLRVIRVLIEIDRHMSRYLGVVTAINLALGTTTALGLYLLGFPDPVFWGTAAFVCNFVPYIGSAAIVAALFIVGLVTLPTVGDAMIVPTFFVVLTTVEGYFVTPKIIGNNFGMSSLAVFLSLAFWTWLWGPIGAFLSVPLLIIASIVWSDLFPDNAVDLPN